MKVRKAFLFCGALLCFSTLQLLAQGGIVDFSNLGVSADRRIYVEGPPGTATLVTGDDFRIALYWGPTGATDDRGFTQVGGSVGFQSGSLAGCFSGGGRTIVSPGLTGGPVLTFQARAFEVAGGNSYEEVLARGDPQSRVGKGPIFEMKTKDPMNSQEPTPRVGDAAGWRGFVIGYDGGGWIIPEPSTITLALLAACSLFFLRRRRP